MGTAVSKAFVVLELILLALGIPDLAIYSYALFGDGYFPHSAVAIACRLAWIFGLISWGFAAFLALGYVRSISGDFHLASDLPWWLAWICPLPAAGCLIWMSCASNKDWFSQMYLLRLMFVFVPLIHLTVAGVTNSLSNYPLERTRS